MTNEVLNSGIGYIISYTISYGIGSVLPRNLYLLTSIFVIILILSWMTHNMEMNFSKVVRMGISLGIILGLSFGYYKLNDKSKEINYLPVLYKSGISIV